MNASKNNTSTENNEIDLTTYEFSATYSPEDNKLRLYVDKYLERELFLKLKEHSFRSAPKQGEAAGCYLFIAPKWSTAREDFLLSLVDMIEDEAQPVAERAAQRAERFAGYREKRRAEAHGCADRSEGMDSTFGHQNEATAKKEANKADRIRGHALDNWSKAEYWTTRTAAVIAHALYKDNPSLRKRRIKGLNTDLRRCTKAQEERETHLKYLDEAQSNPEKIKEIMNCYVRLSMCFTLERFPRDEPISQYEGAQSFWGAIDGGIITAKQAEEMTREAYTRKAAHTQRWINHYTLRIAYETQMLGEQGGEMATAWEVGGTVEFDGDRCTISKVNKGRDGHISSVEITAYSYRIDASNCSNYQAPTEEALQKIKEAKAVKPKRAKLPDILNRSGKREISGEVFKNAKAGWRRSAEIRTEEINGTKYRLRYCLIKVKAGRIEGAFEINAKYDWLEVTLTDKKLKEAAPAKIIEKTEKTETQKELETLEAQNKEMEISGYDRTKYSNNVQRIAELIEQQQAKSEAVKS